MSPEMGILFAIQTHALRARPLANSIAVKGDWTGL
jgi:hypothetical protein